MIELLFNSGLSGEKIVLRAVGFYLGNFQFLIKSNTCFMIVSPTDSLMIDNTLSHSCHQLYRLNISIGVAQQLLASGGQGRNEQIL